VGRDTNRHGTPISVRIVSGALAISWAAVPVLLVRPFLQVIPSVLTLIVLFTCFYCVGIWILIDRPAELKKKLPITSKELRERKKAFYDWLASQGRPERGKGRRHST